MLNLLFVGMRPNAVDDCPTDWDLHVVDTVSDALHYLHDFEPDVVVAPLDLESGGAIALMGSVVVACPSAIRLLAGRTDELGHDGANRTSGLTASRVAHQVLVADGLPLVDVSAVSTAVRRVATARGIIAPDTIRDLVGQIDELPTLGSVYVELINAIGLPTATNLLLGDIVAQDTALTAELLRLVNSAFFGLSRRVDTAAQAIGFLGLDVVRAVVAAHSLFDVDRSGVVDVAAVVRHSQHVAALARKIHLHRGATNGEASRAFLAGMLHEVGVLVLAELPSRDHRELTQVLAAGGVTTERLAFSVDRYTVGGHLLALWAFPDDVVHAVSALGEPLDPTGDGLAWSLRLAQEAALAERMGFDDEADDPALIDELDHDLRNHGFLHHDPTDAGHIHPA